MMVSMLAMALIQSGFEEIAKKDLPKLAHCVVCEAMGSAHGEEKPAAGVRYKDKVYYFCNAKEVGEFKKDPEGFLPPVLPRALPDVRLIDTKGGVWNAEAFKGKTILIDWWATWCAPCKEMMPTLDALQEKYRAKGLVLLSVSIDEKKNDFDAFVKKKPFAGSVVWDENQQFAMFRIKAIPALFVVKDGQIVHEWRGKQRRETIEAALGL